MVLSTSSGQPSTYRANILIVEDDDSLQLLLARTVQKMGHSVLTATSAEHAIDLFAKEEIDLILLDIILPKMDGFEFCKRIRRESNVPIIAVTSLSTTDDLVRMLELGADEYVTKPFQFRVLEMRIEAILRRVSFWIATSNRSVLNVGGLTLNMNKRTAQIGTNEIELTERECSLLRCLMSEPESPISIPRLYEDVWGECNGQEKTMVPTVIQRLRSKLEADPLTPSVIVNVRGYGYKFTKALP